MSNETLREEEEEERQRRRKKASSGTLGYKEDARNRKENISSEWTDLQCRRGYFGKNSWHHLKSTFG